jgi:hypothetical protein
MLRVVRSSIVESFPAYSLKDFLKNLFASSPGAAQDCEKVVPSSFPFPNFS